MNSTLLILGGLALLAVAMSCSSDPDPLLRIDPNSKTSFPAELGESVQTVVMYVTLVPGETIELLTAQPVGVSDGADVRFYLSRPVLTRDGDQVIGPMLEPLQGAVITNPTDSAEADLRVGIVAEIMPHRPGQFLLSNVKLTYRMNGGDVQMGEGIEVNFLVCADTSTPESCEFDG